MRKKPCNSVTFLRKVKYKSISMIKKSNYNNFQKQFTQDWFHTLHTYYLVNKTLLFGWEIKCNIWYCIGIKLNTVYNYIAFLY